MLIKSIQRRQPRLNLYSLHLLFMTLLDMFVGTKMIATWSVVIGLESHICSSLLVPVDSCVCDVI